MLRTFFSRTKFWVYTLVSLLCLFITLVIGCSGSQIFPQYAANPIAQRDTLVQVSTIEALLNGVYDGVLPIGELRRYGDFGLGTFEGLDGEMVGFDGNFYQVKADGIAYSVSDSMKTPFACVTFFDTDHKEKLPAGINFEQLQEYLDKLLPSVNIFHAIRIDGTFSYMKTRSVPGQEKPYPPLVEVTSNQPVFEFNDVEGTIIGFRCPSYVSELNVTGYHLHFLTRNKNAGGHVLEFRIGEAVAFLDYTSDFLMLLPGKDSDFYRLKSIPNRQEEVEKVEK